MRFRDKGNTIQCIRTTYDTTKGRGVDKLVGSLPGDSQFVTAELTPLLTDDERQALTSLLLDRSYARLCKTRSDALVGLAATLKVAQEALRSPQNVALMSAEATAELWAQLDEMRRSLRAAGLSKPKPAADVTM